MSLLLVKSYWRLIVETICPDVTGSFPVIPVVILMVVLSNPEVFKGFDPGDDIVTSSGGGETAELSDHQY